MKEGNIQVYYGEEKGKTTFALGRAIQLASQGKSVIVIQFLKGRNEDEISFIRRLEPEIKFFRFEKASGDYDELTKEEQEEESMNIRNGFNFARKVLVTGECNVLILDEFLGIIQNHMISREELEDLIAGKSEDTELIFTGREMDDMIPKYADEVYRICAEKVDNDREK